LTDLPQDFLTALVKAESLRTGVPEAAFPSYSAFQWPFFHCWQLVNTVDIYVQKLTAIADMLTTTQSSPVPRSRLSLDKYSNGDGLSYRQKLPSKSVSREVERPQFGVNLTKQATFFKNK